MMDIPFDGNNTDDYVIFLTETLLKDFKLFVSWFCFLFVCFWFLKVTMKVLRFWIFGRELEDLWWLETLSLPKC